MAPEERERLAKLEERVANLSADLADINNKLDRLIAAANMGKGAGWIVVKIGGLLFLIFGGISAYSAVRGWHW